MRQGCTLALILFNTYMDWIMERVTSDTDCGVSFGESRVSNLDSLVVDSLVDAPGAPSREANLLGLQVE